MNRAKLSKQMIKMLIIKFAGTFGSGMLSFAIGLYILHRTGSALGMGVSMITGPIVSLVLTPFVGYVVDTMNHRKIMMIAQSATSLGLIAFGLVFHAWPQQYYVELIALIVLLQVTDNFLSTTLTASLIQLFEGDELQQVNSLNQSITSLASFLAPIIGALVYTVVAIDTFAYIEVIFEVAALVGIMLLKYDQVAATDTTTDAEAVAVETEHEAGAVQAAESVWQNFREGFNYLRHQKLMLLMSFSSAGINVFFAALNVGEPFLLVTTLKLTNAQYGITDSAFAVGMFLGGIVLSLINLKQHPIKVSYFFIGILSALLFVLGIPELTGWANGVNTIYYALMNGLFGVVLVFVNTPIASMMQQIIPQNMQGRMFSLSGTLSMMMMPLGTLIYGSVFDHTRAFPVFVVSGVLLLILTIGIVLTISRKHLLELPENQIHPTKKEVVA